MKKSQILIWLVLALGVWVAATAIAHYVLGSFETVQLNFKISRTTENEPSANSIHPGSKLGWMDFY